MTVLVAFKTKDKIILGADTKSFSGDWFKQDCRKIFHENGMIVASTGCISTMQLFQLYCNSRKPESNSILGITRFFVEFEVYCKDILKKTDFKNENSCFMIYDKKLFKFCVAVSEIQENEFVTLGIGRQEAYMSMFIEKDVKKAIERTIEMNAWTGGAPEIVEVEL